MNFIATLEHQVVRDLYWSCFSPNLFDDYAQFGAADVFPFNIALNQERKHWLTSLDRNPAPLLRHLNNLKSTRLGLYFEALWQYFLTHDEQFDLLANNLPVHDDKGITLGEFDLLCKDLETGEYLHLELAIKFYLSTLNNADGINGWYGPNCRDRLDLKLNHLLKKQIQLIDNQAASGQLEKIYSGAWKKQIALRGFLFYQQDQLESAHSHSVTQFSAAHQPSQWLTISNIDQLGNQSALNQSHWQLLNREQWLSPAVFTSSERSQIVTDFDSIKAEIELLIRQHDRPVMQIGRASCRERVCMFV